MKTLVILTGAGISAESGLATFRDNNGLWCNHRIEDVATPEAYARNPKLVHEFYNMRRSQLKEAHPNTAHNALAKLAHEWPGKFLLVTQNVDDLHDRAHAAVKPAGGFKLLHMHGELKKVRCERCDDIHPWEDALSQETSCPSCTQPGYVRPHIVWFGEMPLEMDLIYHYLGEADIFISIGTSGNVYPAAGFVHEVRSRGRGRCVELNMEPTVGKSLFHEGIYGPATKVVPQYVETLLAA